MKSGFILFYFLFVSLLIQAQSTGYMGKRLSVCYGAHTSPAFFGATAKNETIIGSGGNATSGTLAFNLIHEGSLEFAASSKWMICFSTRYYKTAFDNNKEIIDYSTNTTVEPNGYYNIRGLTYTLYFKYYGSRYVAPWGRYLMFGPTMNTVKTSYDPAIMNYKARYNYGSSNPNSDSLYSSFGPREQSFRGFNFMLGYGRSRIIANRVIIDYGLNLQLFSVASGAFELVFEDDFVGNSVPTSYIENTVKSRVRGINRVNVFLKVGVLLF